MDPRPIDEILQEWRQRERELEDHPNADLEALHARIAALRDEHARALAKREREAEELRRRPRMVDV
jgi:hypothetical protein